MRQVIVQYRKKWHDGDPMPVRTSLIIEDDKQIEEYLKNDDAYDGEFGFKIVKDNEVKFPIVLGHTTYWTE
jgi:hypothetical protein